MLFGVCVDPTDYTFPLAKLAPLAEDRGFESLWVPEHPAVPVQQAAASRPRGEPSREYLSLMDPFVALAFAAAVTKRIKLGTGVCLISERDAIHTAKEVSSLDVLSEGRVLLGIGASRVAEELGLFGTPFEERWTITRERIRAMERLWNDDEPEFHGRFVDFPKVRFFPKPVQKPRPPILIGSRSRWALRRVVQWADGWIPVYIGPDEFRAGMDTLRQFAAEAGRDMSTISATVFSIDPDADLVRSFADAGAGRIVFHLPPAGEAEVVAALDQCAMLARDFTKASA